MQKIFDFNAGTYVYVDDDDAFFPRKPASAPARRITCRVCERAGTQAADGVLLCHECAALGADELRSHIGRVKDGAASALDRAWAALEQALASADEGLLIRWGAFQDAVGRSDAIAHAAEDKARGGMSGALADLIRMWCHYRDAQTTYEDRARWAALADLTIVLWQDEVLS